MMKLHDRNDKRIPVACHYVTSAGIWVATRIKGRLPFTISNHYILHHLWHSVQHRKVCLMLGSTKTY
jgi:hypothetical protein